MDDHAARLLVAALALLALSAVAARRRLVAIVRAAAAATSAALAPGRAGGGGRHGGRSSPPAEPTARPAWSAWQCVPAGLRDDETGRIVALAAVALKAHAAGALVDLRGAVDRGEKPDDLVLVALEELAAPWRSWPEVPPAADPPPSINA